jgi:hypothetical protein
MRKAISASILLALGAWILGAASPNGGGRSDEIPFVKHTIDLGANEACAWADVNGDGKLDIVSGENWFEAPKWTKHRFRDLNFWDNYIDDFSDLPMDVDGDGRVDIVSVGWSSKKMSWWKNPGKIGAEWKETVIESGSPIEFAFLVDLDNDGKALEILPQFGDSKQPLAWYEARNGKFEKHVVSPQSYGHGIGVGDVNGDGRADILTPKGWFEAPADPRNGLWPFHGDWDFASDALGFMYVLDVNGDGRPDIVTSMAHNYGVFWMERMPDGKWVKHIIDEAFSQSHAMTLVDWAGDGRKSLLTGKRFMAHNGHDPGEREPLGIFWYEWITPLSGVKQWARHVIDYGSRTGSGMQIAVADYDNDGDLDFAVAGKSGLFLFENQTVSSTKK